MSRTQRTPIPVDAIITVLFLSLVAESANAQSERAVNQASQPASQPATQPASQPATQPASQPVSQPAQPASRDPYNPNLDATGTPALPNQDRTKLPPSSAAAGVRRPAPDYDGRGDDPPTAGDVLIWIPRILTFPAHLVLEYLVRWPLVGGMTLAEEHYLFKRIERLFSYRSGNSYLFPTAFFDFGLNPTVGFFNVNNDLFYRGHSLTLQGGFWDGWVNLELTNKFPVFHDDSGVITFGGKFFTRPDQVFHGIGPNSRYDNEMFYRLRNVEVETELRAFLTDLNRISFSLLYRHAKTADGDAPSVADPVHGVVSDERLFPAFGEAYQLIVSRLQVELDTRSPDRVFTPGSGLRMELFGSFHIDPSDRDLHFFRWGGEAAGFIDVSGINHVLALRVYSEFIEKSGNDPVPVPELIFLGGAEHMRGFLEGRLRGESALVVTADYRYPVWTFLDADIFASVGNTFAGHYEDFHIKRLFFTWGIGLRSNTSRDVSFDAMVAFGTSRFDADTFSVDHVRAVFGINQGF